MPIIVIETICLIAAILYITYFEPKAREKRNRDTFDDCVISFLEGLNFAGDIHNRYIHDLRSYVTQQLSQSRSLPGNQSSIEYTSTNGHVFRTHTGPNDYVLFAVLCIAQYAKTYEIEELTSWCESRISEASHFSFRL